MIDYIPRGDGMTNLDYLKIVGDLIQARFPFSHHPSPNEMVALSLTARREFGHRAVRRNNENGLYEFDDEAVWAQWYAILYFQSEEDLLYALMKN
jgi:hypothetical protein